MKKSLTFKEKIIEYMNYVNGIHIMITNKGRLVFILLSFVNIY